MKHYFVLGTLSIFLVCSLHFMCVVSVLIHSMSFKTPQQTRTILINYFPNIYDHLHLQTWVHSGDGSWGYITILRTTIREIRSQATLHKKLFMPILEVSKMSGVPKRKLEVSTQSKYLHHY